jgi:hypothetical protein
MPTYKVGCSLCTCKCVEERRKGETHVHRPSPHLTGRGEGRRLSRAHDVRMNSPLKSGPKPHRSMDSFCNLFLLRDHV